MVARTLYPEFNMNGTLQNNLHIDKGLVGTIQDSLNHNVDGLHNMLTSFNQVLGGLKDYPLQNNPLNPSSDNILRPDQHLNPSLQNPFIRNNNWDSQSNTTAPLDNQMMPFKQSSESTNSTNMSPLANLSKLKSPYEQMEQETNNNLLSMNMNVNNNTS